MKVEHLVRATCSTGLFVLSRDEARELYDALHAEFGPTVKDSLTVLPFVGPRPYGPGRANLEQWREWGKPEQETGPTLQDDIERMVAEIGAQTGIQEVPHDVVPASGTVDDADEQEAEFLSRLPQIAVASDVADSPSTVNGIPVGELTMPPVSKFDPTPCCSGWPWCDCDDTPEPPAEPVTAQAVCHDIPAPDVTATCKTGETDSERAVRLWHSYRAKRPDELPNSAVGRVKSHLKHLSTPQIRELLRASGIDIPDPQSQAEAAAKARYAQAAKRQAEAKPDEPEPAPLSLVERILDAWLQNRDKYPKSLYPDSFVVGKVGTRCKVPSADVRTILREQGISVEEPMTRVQAGQLGGQVLRDSNPEPKPQPSKVSMTLENSGGSELLDRFPEPPANLDVLDALALTWEILDESRPQISSFITTRVGLPATMAYKAAVEAFKPEYEAMAPFARRDFKSAIAARWHKERAA